MTIDFPYSGYEGIEPAMLSDENVLGVYAPRTLDPVSAAEVLARAIAEPIGARRLRDEVRAGDRVLILVDDATPGRRGGQSSGDAPGRLSAVRRAGTDGR